MYITNNLQTNNSTEIKEGDEKVLPENETSQKLSPLNTIEEKSLTETDDKVLADTAHDSVNSDQAQPPKVPVMTYKRLRSLSAAKKPSYLGPIEPDPFSERDLENASPEAIEICNECPCHFCFYIYSRPCDVDQDTFPFRNLKAFKEKKKEKQESGEIPENDDTPILLPDRRINSIEISSGCKIYLGSLKGYKNMKRGLPRRLLTIAGPTFSHITMALHLVESHFPRLMQFAMFPYRLPSDLSTKYSTADKMCYSSNIDTNKMQYSTVGLRNSIDDNLLLRYAVRNNVDCPDQVK